MELAADFGLELSAPAQVYGKYVAFGFAFPVVIWLAGIALTRAGRIRHNLGAMLAALLFGFALLWAIGAIMAFQKAYDPPRESHAPSNQTG